MAPGEEITVYKRLFTVRFAAIIIAATMLLASGTSGALYVLGELVLKMEDGYDVGIINDEFGTSIGQHLPLIDVYLLDGNPDYNLDSLSVYIARTEGVAFCHPNYRVDPLQPVQGSIPFSDNQFIGSYQNQIASSELNLAGTHSVSTGTGISVAVLDGGVNYTHPAFEGWVESGWDYVDDDPDAFDEPGGDNSGHGTFVAGVIHLVAPEATIRAYRVTDIEGESNGYVVAEAIMQAIADGCRVINLSMVMLGEHLAIADAVAYAKEQNVAVVVAAGNGQDDLAGYPASDPNTIAVAAIDSNLTLADFSNFGNAIDVCAPGVNIYAPYQDTGYAWWGGTSFSAPFVSAQAALLLSEAPSLTWPLLRNAIINTALDIDQYNLAYNNMLGSGLIDPLASLLQLLGGAGAASGCDHYTIDGETPGSLFGYAVATGRDVDLDGASDILVGAQNADGEAGRAYLYSGATGALLHTFSEPEPDRFYFGTAVDFVDDISGDGVPDLLITSPANGSCTGCRTGRVYVYSGADGSLVRTQVGSSQYGGFGLHVAGIPDVDHDGRGDIIVGAPDLNAFGYALVYSGDHGNLVHSFTGTQYDAWFGWRVADAGDVNNDGVHDIVVGEPGNFYPDTDRDGWAHVYSGANGEPLLTMTGDITKQAFGWHVDGAGDIDNDGYDDLVVSGTSLFGLYSGQTGELIRIQQGRHTIGCGDVDNDGFDDVATVATDGLAVYSGRHGAVLYAVAADVSTVRTGDVNSDGYPDLVVGDYDDFGLVDVRLLGDGDCDGIPNESDNCTDVDGDGYGDSGYPNNTCILDNCPTTYNPAQLDPDDDGFGTACDNCPEVYNPAQLDSDRDTVGNACDNCPGLSNEQQIDSDDNGIGDACQACCVGSRGDVYRQGEDEVDLADVIYLVNALFLGGPEPECAEEANVDGDWEGNVDLPDVIYLVNSLFLGGPPPAVCD
ncbi:S8 family serine peptidase [candidate division GN15 bacterium]|nr:S8 family serine peptidase [candidate division GN15 bacterium]